MTGCVGIVVLVAVTTGACVGGIALSRTGGCSHRGSVAMALGGDAHIKVEAAVGSSIPCVAARAGGGASGFLGDLIAIIRGIQLGEGHGGVTGTLGAGTSQGAGRRGGRCLGRLVAVTVAGCRGIVVLIAVAAGTGVGGVTLSRTGGCRHLGSVAMPLGSDADIKVEAAVGGRLPGIAARTS